MYASLWKLGWETTLLAMETQQVVALRITQLMTGGPAAALEVQRLVSEKVLAAGEAACPSPWAVSANKRRLSKAERKPGTD